MNHDMQDIQTEITPQAIVRKVKFDPTQKALKGITEGITYYRGDLYTYESSVLERVLGYSATSSPQTDIANANDIASEFETSITKHRKLWGSVPTIKDYFELDALNNVEEVESDFYRASKEFGW